MNNSSNLVRLNKLLLCLPFFLHLHYYYDSTGKTRDIWVNFNQIGSITPQEIHTPSCPRGASQITVNRNLVCVKESPDWILKQLKVK